MSGRKESTTGNVRPGRNKSESLMESVLPPKKYGTYQNFCKKTKKRHEHGGSHHSKFHVLHFEFVSVFAAVSRRDAKE
ncbi:hypothetical protein TNCV_2995111 [Trichonephila clavipes]|nr:hypothetical protein TNCV_2995111 [Trichonephila clavipes]